MYKIKLVGRKLCILAGAFLAALLETLMIALGIVVVGTFVAVVLPVLSWIGTAVAAKAKLRMVR